MNVSERCDASYKQVVRQHCYDALAEAGFTRFRKEGVDWPMEHGVHCWVGLNATVEAGYISVNPFVGVHVVPVEKLISIKVGKYPMKYDRRVATFAVHMGQLTPNARAFHFTQQTDLKAEAARLARLYTDVGLSYALSIGTYELLLPLLLDRVPMLGAYPERVAACLYLMCRKDEARAFVEDFLKENRDYFEGFAVPFLKMLND